MISIIIPTFNECNNSFLEQSLKKYSKLNVEVICVDSESTDGTIDLIKKYKVKFINHPTSSRGERLTVGAKQASYPLVILHHPRSFLDINAIDYLIHNQNKINWGAFTHRFDLTHPLLKFTSWYSNFVRGDLKGIFYLDHCIFVKKNILEQINYIPFVDIFEDTLLSEKLLKISKPLRLPFISTTSAIRFRKNGIWRQALRNQLMKILYWRNTDHEKLNKIYEKGAPLNTKNNNIM